MITNIKFLLEILFLPGILGIGILSGLSDIKTGRVKNSLIKKGFLYGLIIYSLIIAWTLLRDYLREYVFYNSQFFYLKFNYFPALIINVAIAFVVGIIFWKFDIWAAADAKLFTLYSFLIPLTVYVYERVPYFPSFALLVNIYIVSLLYLFLIYLWRIKIGSEDLKRFFSEGIPKIIHGMNISKIFDYLSLFFISFSIAFSLFFLVISRVRPSASLTILFYIAGFAVLMSLGGFLNKYKKIKVYLSILAIIYMIIWFIFSATPLFILNQFLLFIFYMVIINLIFKLFGSLAASDIKIINIEDLKQNMILTTDALRLLSKDQEFYKNLGNIYPDGLSPEQTEKIKEFFKNKDVKTVEVCKTFPFAVFIFIGAIITLIIQGSLIGWLITIL